MNTQGIEVERALGRPILSGLHGLWSVGLGLGAGAAVLAAAAGLDPLAHFAIVGGVLALAATVAMRGLLPRQRMTADADGDQLEVRWTPRLLLLGGLAFCSFVGEGAASDWSAVYLAQELSASPATAAAAFAAFAVAMAAGRFGADPLRARVGPVALVRAGGAVAGAGLLLGLVVHEPAAAIAGFALLGVGLGPTVPIVFGAAGDVAPGATGRAVSRVATLGYVGSVVGPIVIGWLAEATSLRASLGLVVLLAGVIALGAKAVAPKVAAGGR
jgi:fucose permease